MKKWIFGLFLFSAILHSQLSNPAVRYVAVAPSGSCTLAPPIQVVDSSGTIYTCDNGTWAAQTGGGGGGDSITSPNSTLTVGGSSADTTLDIALGNANTWSALQTFGTDISIGGVTPSGATGTGNIVFGTSPTLVTPALGTPTSGVITNLTGTCAACTSNNTVEINGGTVPASAGLLGTNSSSQPIAVTALPNGTTATTQTTGDNTTKVATDAFVLANAGGGGGPSYSLTADTNIAAGTGVSVNSAGHAQQTWGPAPNVAGVVTIFPEFGSSYASIVTLSDPDYVAWTAQADAASVASVTRSGTSLTVGTVNSSISYSIAAIVPLTSSSFVLVDPSGNAFACSISAGIITPGASSSSGISGNKIIGAKLSSTQFLLLDASSGTAIIGTVAAGVITFGTPATIGSGSFTDQTAQIEVLSSSIFAVIFGDGNSSGVFTAIGVSVGVGGALTQGTPATISDSSAGIFAQPGVLSSTTFAALYASESSAGPAYGVVASVNSGTLAVTLGTPQLVSAIYVYPPVALIAGVSGNLEFAMTVIDSTHVAFGAGGVLPEICTISGTSLSVPSLVSLSNSGYPTVGFIDTTATSLAINGLVPFGSGLLVVDGVSNLYETDGTANTSPSIAHANLFNYGLNFGDSTHAVAWFSDFNGNFQARVITYELINSTPPIGITAAGATSGNPVTVALPGSVVTGLSGGTAGTNAYWNGDGTITSANTGHLAGTWATSTSLVVQ